MLDLTTNMLFNLQQLVVGTQQIDDAVTKSKVVDDESSMTLEEYKAWFEREFVQIA